MYTIYIYTYTHMKLQFIQTEAASQAAASAEEVLAVLESAGSKR